MRLRIAAFVTATLIAVVFNAHAATPKAQIVATNLKGQVVVLSTASNTFIVKEKPLGSAISLKLTCLKLLRFTGQLIGTPVVVPEAGTMTFASGTKSGKTYYLSALSIAQKGGKKLQAVVSMAVAGNQGGGKYCGTDFVQRLAGGVAYYN